VLVGPFAGGTRLLFELRGDQRYELGAARIDANDMQSSVPNQQKRG
jgi:hypothetical protein